jgi:hypothetical protein
VNPEIFPRVSHLMIWKESPRKYRDLLHSFVLELFLILITQSWDLKSRKWYVVKVTLSQCTLDSIQVAARNVSASLKLVLAFTRKGPSGLCRRL